MSCSKWESFNSTRTSSTTSTRDSPYAFPAIDALLPKIHAWAASSLESRAGYYTPEELEEEESPPRVPKLPRRKAAAKATPTGGGPKPKRPTTASLASDMQGLLSTLPKITEQLSQISERQAALESRIPLPGKAPAIGLGQSLASNLNAPPPPVSELMRTLRPPPTQSQTLKPLWAGNIKPFLKRYRKSNTCHVAKHSLQTWKNVTLAG